MSAAEKLHHKSKKPQTTLSCKPGVVKVHHIGYPCSFAIPWRKQVFFESMAWSMDLEKGGLFHPVIPWIKENGVFFSATLKNMYNG